MSNLRNSDLMIVGRNGDSYKLSVADVSSHILNGNALPDVDNGGLQNGTLDDRYLLLAGGTLTGTLTLAADPVNDLEAATKAYVDTAVGSIDVLPDMAGAAHQDGTLDTRFVEISGDTMVGDLLLGNAIDGDTPNSAAVRKDYVDAADNALTTSINALAANLASQVVSLTGLISDVDDKVDAETERAELAETALGTRIDELELNDLTDVNVSGAADLQVLSYDAVAEKFVPRTIVLSSTLVYRGQVDLTDGTDAPASPVNGDLYVNTATSGSVAAAWGATLQSQITSLSGGEMIAYNEDAFVLVGNIGGGLTYESFSVATDDAAEGGALNYNNQTGIFTFSPADVDSRIPRNVSTLAALPA